MSDATQHLRLPFIMPSQAQKHVTHNEALQALDALVQLAVLDRDLPVPPASPEEGARYLVAAGPSGAWTGHGGEIAAFQDGGWSFHPPRTGWRVWVADEERLLVRAAADWIEAGTTPSRLGVNATADGTNRLAVRAAAALFDNEGTDHRLKINKASAGNTASVLFQTGYSGRAEFGTAGDDRFRIKVSADGTSWREAAVIDPATGYLGIGTDAPEGPLHIRRLGAHPVHERVDDSTTAPTVLTCKARGTPAAKTAVIAGDIIQAFLGSGHDGTSYVPCANLRWVVDGPPSLGSVPTRLEFLTFTPGSGNAERMRVTQTGDVGIGVTAPSARLHVNGAVRLGQYLKAALPAAAASGPGALVYVGDETGGPVLAFSDGTSWRRVTDRAVVT